MVGAYGERFVHLLPSLTDLPWGAGDNKQVSPTALPSQALQS